MSLPKPELPSPKAIQLAGNLLSHACHSAALTGNWWPEIPPPLSMIGWKLALIHSEVSEACEGFRKNLKDDKLPHRKMAEVELADAAIRIFDLAGAMGFDIGGAIQEKLAFNAVRVDHKLESREALGGKKY